ncbi:flavodoxin family protein, partial [Enterococcus faecalis]|nr:flavodoxin family protein [Enterococcus faecalis]
KKDIENSSIVIFASPVYFKNVSAGMKLLLDQITSWTHTFELLGKFGVIIVCGSLNGSTETIEYLNDFMLRLGLGSIGIIEYNSNLDTEETLTEKIESISKKLATKINDDSPPEPNTIQKEIYKNYELSSINDRFNTFEKQKWENMREKYYGMNLEEIMTAKYKEATN